MIAMIFDVGTQAAYRVLTEFFGDETEAKREHRSLNNIVEVLLYEALENRPNPETMEAIEEARSAKDKETFDSVESLMNELMK